MGVNIDTGNAVFLKEKNMDITELACPLNLFIKYYKPVYNDKKELDLGTFCIQAGLFGITYGCLSLKDASKEAVKNVKEKAWITIND